VTSTLGLTATLALAIAGVLAVLVRRRRRAARPAGPRTVAELVELRARKSAPAADPESNQGAGDGAAPADVAAPGEVESVGRVDAGAPSTPGSGDEGVQQDASVDVPPWERARHLAGNAVPDSAPVGGEARREVERAAVDGAAPDESVGPADPADDGATPDGAGGSGAGTGGDVVATGPAPGGAAAPGAEEVGAAAESAAENADATVTGQGEHPETTGSDGGGSPEPREPDRTEVDRPDVDEVVGATGSVVVPTNGSRGLSVARIVIPDQRRPSVGAAPPVPVPDPAPADDGPILLSGVDDVVGSEPDRSGPARPVGFRVVRCDGSVVGGAAATLLDRRGRSLTRCYSDAHGGGELTAPHPARYLIVCTAPEHQPSVRAVSTLDGPVTTEVLLTRSASVTGSVYGPRGPLVGARLTLRADGELVGTATSGADGGYLLPELAAGRYGLSAAAGGFEPATVRVDLAAAARHHRDITLSSSSGVAVLLDVDRAVTGPLMVGNG
jgi:hypothetical protein